MPVTRENPRIRSGKAVLTARLAMGWERFATVWMPPALLLTAVATAALWGLLDIIPPAVRFGLVAALIAAASALAIVNLVRLRWPSVSEAAERVEVDYGGEPDELASGNSALWAAHMARVEAALAQARAGRMGAGIAAADPMALRYALAVAVALGLWAFGPDKATSRVAQAFEPVGVAGDYAGVMMARASDVAEDSVVVASLALGRWGGPHSPIEPPAEFQRASLQSSAQMPGSPRILPAASRP